MKIKNETNVSIILQISLQGIISDLYEILNLSSFDSSELQQKVWWRSMHAHTCTSKEGERTIIFFQSLKSFKAEKSLVFIFIYFEFSY